MNKKIHHAVVVEGNAIEGINWTKEYIKNTLKMELLGNPDINIAEIERYTIKDARSLKARASKTPFGDSQVFVIVTENILHEAQNALLKLFEEPAQDTYFIIVIPTTNGLLDTVMSRIEYKGRIFDKPNEINFAKEFLNSNVGERIKMLESTIKNKDRKKAREIVNAIEAHLHDDDVQKNSIILKEIYFIRKYLNNRSSSLKMLLEHLAVII